MALLPCGWEADCFTCGHLVLWFQWLDNVSTLWQVQQLLPIIPVYAYMDRLEHNMPA